MTKNLDNKGLKSIVNDYDFFFIDLWGVVHNGIELHKKAIDVLIKISEAKKDYILITNAPRPKDPRSQPISYWPAVYPSLTE